MRLLLPGVEGGQGIDSFWWFNDLEGHATVQDNRWHTFVASYDGTTRSMYLDGTLIAQDAPGVNAATDLNFAIGMADPSNSTNASFIGSIDSVAIFSTAESLAQVQAVLPEPASLAVPGIGALGLAAARRRGEAKSTAVAEAPRHVGSCGAQASV